MALFVNDSDTHVTIPDGCGGALIVPAGCEAVLGPDGPLIARPLAARAEVDGVAPLVELPVELDGSGEQLPPFDPDNPGPHRTGPGVAVADVIDPVELTPAAVDEVVPPKRRGGKG